MVGLLTTVLFPLLVLLAISAPVAIPFLFGPHWVDAVVPAQILCLGGGATLVANAAGTVLMASGRARALLGFGLAHFLTYGLTVLLVVHLGIVAVAIDAAVVHTLFAVLAYALMLRGSTEHPLRRLWEDIGPAVVSCLGLVAVALPVSVALTAAAVPRRALAGPGGAGGRPRLPARAPRLLPVHVALPAVGDRARAADSASFSGSPIARARGRGGLLRLGRPRPFRAEQKQPDRLSRCLQQSQSHAPSAARKRPSTPGGIPGAASARSAACGVRAARGATARTADRNAASDEASADHGLLPAGRVDVRARGRGAGPGRRPVRDPDGSRTEGHTGKATRRRVRNPMTKNALMKSRRRSSSGGRSSPNTPAP